MLFSAVCLVVGVYDAWGYGFELVVDLILVGV